MDPELEAVARGVAWEYATRLHPLFEWRDLYQEAWFAILMAERSYHADRGASLPTYTRAAARRWLYGYTVRSRAPIAGHTHVLDELRKACAVQLPDESIEDPGPVPIDPAPLPLDALVAALWCARVRLAVSDVLVDYGAAQGPVWSVLADGARPAEAARAAGVPVAGFYRTLNKARRELRGDVRLWKLWRNQ